jgi:PAS domain S-box-containing protein
MAPGRAVLQYCPPLRSRFLAAPFPMPQTTSASQLLAAPSAPAGGADSRFQSLVESIDGVFFEYDTETNCFTYVSRRAESFLGFSLADWFTPNFWAERLHPQDAHRTITTCKTLTDAAVDHVLDYRLVAADGRVVWVHDVVSVHSRPGRTPLLSGVMLDVTREREQERLIEQLSQSALHRTGEDFFLALTRQLAELLGAELVLVGELVNDGAHIRTLAAYRGGTHIQPVVYDVVGRACAEVLEKGSLVADGDLQARFGAHPVVAQLALDSLVSSALCSPQGARTGVLAVGFPGRVSNPERFLRPLHIFAARAGAELERVRAEREARASEQRVRELIDALPDKAFLFDREGRYLIAHVPSHLAPLVPVDTLLGRRMDEVLPSAVAADFMRELSQVFETGVARQFERELDFGAERRTYEFRLVPFGPERAIKLCRDITDQRRLEQQLVQSQKLESLGRLAGGVAHDFNNLLTGILSYAELAQVYSGDEARVRTALASISRAGEAAARRQSNAPRVLAVSDFVREQQAFLRRVLGERVRLAVTVDGHHGRVRIDPVQLQQVLLNLAINARDALHENGGIWIEVANARLDAGLEQGCAPGDYVRISVIDDGEGMSEATREHLFEPFFTTKDLGRGTGMGLATCYGITRQCGGMIRVESELGRGSRVDVFLPAVDVPATHDPIAPQASLCGSEEVLLVEDRELVREALTESLGELGYRVTAVADAEQALQLFESAAERFSALVSDVVLPRMRGDALAERLCGLEPQLGVVLMTGYSEATPDGAPWSARVRTLRKPVTATVVAAAVREVLSVRL